MLARPIVFIIDAQMDRVAKAQAALSNLYDLKIYGEGPTALRDMYALKPALVLVDEQTLSKQGAGIHRTKCNDKVLKHIPFIIISNTNDGPFLAGDGSGAMDHFMRRPVSIETVMRRIAKSLNAEVEKSWESLPQSAQSTLQESANNFGSIAKAIAGNQPLDKSMVTASSNPLVSCVKDNQHKHVLMGLRKHHNFTYVHSMRVAVFMAVFADAYNVSQDEMTMLASGGYMHDVGMTMLPDSILNKADCLNDHEWESVRKHVAYSCDILDEIEGISPIVRIIVEHHHERLDGSGYPYGLEGADINELGRMAAIADIFAGLTDQRPSQVALSPENAFVALERMGDKLDRKLLHLFREAILD